MAKDANPDIPTTEPEKSQYYLRSKELRDLQPDKNVYDARLAFAMLWQRKYGQPYVFTVNSRAKTPHGQVGLEMKTMADVLTAAKQRGLTVRQLIQAFLESDDPYYKRRAHKMEVMATNLPQICNAASERRKRLQRRSPEHQAPSVADDLRREYESAEDPTTND